MTAGVLEAAKVLHGRIKTINFNKDAAFVWGRTGLKDSVVESCSEVVPDNEIELDDGQTVYEKVAVYRLELTVLLPELDSTDIALIETADEVEVVTANGGAGSGVTMSADLDFVSATCEGLKTRVFMVAQGTSRPYKIADN
ncbi:MAG: hypothetical protein PHV11_06325 [Candidatus Bipolaricaulis sp.]|nr:hypothetical protein [Candidatus Bipolaricaulis sp.]